MSPVERKGAYHKKEFIHVCPIGNGDTMEGRIEIIMGDITQLEIEAIVNAANTTLQGGGGVDGAIHAAAGPGLLEECRILNGCDTGQAKITAGHNLPARWVIHTVGPVWRGGNNGEDELLASCYRNSLELASQNGILDIAFPSISTGAYGFPLDRAAVIAVSEIRRFLASDPVIRRVVIVCFSRKAMEQYNLLLKE